MGEVGAGGRRQGLRKGVAGHWSFLVVGLDDLQQLTTQSLILKTHKIKNKERVVK